MFWLLPESYQDIQVFDKKKHTITEAYFAIWDEDWNLLEDLHLLLKNDDGEVIGEQQAFETTGINPETHLLDPDTITYTEGREKLLAMLTRHKIPKKRKHYMPAGHNILFDLNFIWEQLIEKEDWEKTVHYGKKMDTYIVCTFLQDMGILPDDLGKLTSLVEYFGIPMGKAHTARGDIEMNIDVYKAIKAMMYSKKQDMAAISTNSLLEIIEQWKTKDETCKKLGY